MTPGTAVVGYLDDGTWSACFGLSYRDLLLHDAMSSQRIVREGGIELRAITGTGGIVGSRNQVARDFLDSTDGEWLFTVDTDMGFAPDTVDRLVATAEAGGVPVVGGLCFAMKRRQDRGDFYAERFRIQPTLFEWLQLPDEVGFRPILDYKRDAVMQVAGTGAACVLIHRSALVAVREKYGDAWYDPVTHPTGDPGGRPRTFSEDLSFCFRLAAVDLPVHVDTSVKTCHDKGGVFLDEALYDQQETRSNAAQPVDEAIARGVA